MSEQRGLFDSPPQTPRTGNGTVPPADRFEGAVLYSAIGDALGWPTEFIKEIPTRKVSFSLPVKDFVGWQKFVGGRWWGYRDDIAPGDYSDDTQLALAVSRCIAASGDFEPDRFAYSELPMWLHYERGGGRSVKTAARALLKPKSNWLHNFYRTGQIDYRQAGANGAAMRNLPIALVSVGDDHRLLRDSFLNSIITHGHPRAIIGTILIGGSVRFILTESHSNGHMIDYLHDLLYRSEQLMEDEEKIRSWVSCWEKQKGISKGNFKALFAKTRSEAFHYLDAVNEFLRKPTDEYARFVGALRPETKGSGLSTVCVAIFLFLKLSDRPHECLYAAANLLGSDTDTIASFVGSLLGAKHGVSGIPRHLLEQIQDRHYLSKVAAKLHSVISGEPQEQAASERPFVQREALLRMLAWELGLHEMFWDALSEGEAVVHPTLGKGTIAQKQVRDIAREGYVAKLIKINFDCGQSCVFHSRVENNEKVSESLGRELEKALG